MNRSDGLFLLILFCLGFHSLKAQKKEILLQGYLGVSGGYSYSYKLVFTDSSGFLKGFAYTYLHEGQDVKAAITGFLDRKNKTLSFEETEIIYNHGFESNTTICLIKAKLKFSKSDDGKSVFSGNITSKDITDVYCGQGSVSFPDTEKLNRIFEPENEKSEIKPEGLPKPSRPMRIVYDTASYHKPISDRAAANAGSPEKITSGSEKTIEWDSDTLVMQIWDGGKIDGDIISVRFNEETVLSRFSISEVPKILKIRVPENRESRLIVKALNTGNEPPNTADVLLRDGSITHRLVFYNNTGKEGIIKILRK